MIIIVHGKSYIVCHSYLYAYDFSTENNKRTFLIYNVFWRSIIALDMQINFTQIKIIIYTALRREITLLLFLYVLFTESLSLIDEKRAYLL